MRVLIRLTAPSSLLVEGRQVEAVVEEDLNLKKTAGKLLIAAWCEVPLDL